MTFENYGQSLKNEKADFVKEIAKLVTTSEQTVYRWLSGEFVPSKIRQEVIAKYMNTTPEELWPTKATDHEELP